MIKTGGHDLDREGMLFFVDGRTVLATVLAIWALAD
jgi:hypothetical protein